MRCNLKLTTLGSERFESLLHTVAERGSHHKNKKRKRHARCLAWHSPRFRWHPPCRRQSCLHCLSFVFAFLGRRWRKQTWCWSASRRVWWLRPFCQPPPFWAEVSVWAPVSFFLRCRSHSPTRERCALVFSPPGPTPPKSFWTTARQFKRSIQEYITRNWREKTQEFFDVGEVDGNQCPFHCNTDPGLDTATNIVALATKALAKWMQHVGAATLLHATCCVRLATMLHNVAFVWPILLNMLHATCCIRLAWA